MAATRPADAGARRLGYHHAVRPRRLGRVPRQRFCTAGSILGSLAGLNGFGGVLAEAKLLATAALASALIPSAHEMKDRLLRPMPVVAVATALLAAFCVLEVGKGAPVNFIYFQF